MRAASRVAWTAGRRSPRRTPMIEITTRSSTSVKARGRRGAGGMPPGLSEPTTAPPTGATNGRTGSAANKEPNMKASSGGAGPRPADADPVPTLRLRTAKRAANRGTPDRDLRRLLPPQPRARGTCPWCRPRSPHALLGRLVGLLTPGPTLSPSHVRPAHVTWGERNAMASMTTVVLPGHSGGAVPESHRSSLLSPPSPAAAEGHQRLEREFRDRADPVNEPRRRPHNRHGLTAGRARA